MNSRFARWVCLSLASALAVACSSTTQLGTGAGDSLTGAPTARSSGSAGPGVPTTAPSAPGTDGGTATTIVRSGATGSGSGGTGGVAPTGGEIRIGIEYPGDQSGLAAAFGVNVLTGSADWKTFIQPVVDEVNRQGGIAGRKVVPVWHTTDASRGSFAAQGQSVCSHFTEDDDVFAAIGFVLDPSEIACFRAHGTPFIGEAVTLSDQALFDANRGWYYQPHQITVERLVPAMVASLAQSGYFPAGAKIGLLRMDEPVAAKMEGLLRKELAARGVTFAADAVISVPPSAADAGSLFTQAAGAILRFRDAGVDHVLPVPSASVIPFVFMNQAETQAYRPIYAMTSLDIPAFMAPNAPKAQLHGSVGVGWMNGSDIHFTEVPRGVNANEDLCRTLTKRNGDEAKRYCDGLFFLRDAMARAPEVSPGGLLVGVEALGDSYTSPWAGPTRFGPGRYDGAATIKPLRYLDECGCFRYSGPPIPVG